MCSRAWTEPSASLVSDVPLGVMLSGGVDSSAVAALAVRHVSGQELKSYSVAFGRPDDESVAAARLAEQLGMRHRTLRVSEVEVRAEFESWLSDLDYPAGNPTWIASAFIAHAAREDGIKVLLSGDGGDELFGGYTRWMKYLRFHDMVWSRVPRVARRLGGRATRNLVGGLAGDIARRASTDRGLFVPSRPFHDDLLERSLGPVGTAAAALRPPETRIEELRRDFDARYPDGDYLAWMSYVSLKTKVVEDFLQRLEQDGDAAFGRRSRAPARRCPRTMGIEAPPRDESTAVRAKSTVAQCCPADPPSVRSGAPEAGVLSTCSRVLVRGALERRGRAPSRAGSFVSSLPIERAAALGFQPGR